ncbi:lysyl oxidase family protein [Actinocrispum sp. NPDC049592]|uniref:lysyl oxidase family protein n=1 Tax=Actinocrispum sp. NPDC049592 TaxID=3154835 RepID=UPI003448C6D9
MTGYSSARTAVLLPDLREAPPGCQEGSSPGVPCAALDVCMVDDPQAPSSTCLDRGPAQAVRIRFTSSVDNVGDGPLVLYGHRESTRTATMSVRQAFQAGGSGPIPQSFNEAQQPIPGSMYYEPSKSHVHWHFLDFEHFELRTATGQTLVTDRKNGFCLGDRYTTYDAGTLRNTPDPDDTTTPQGTFAKFLADNNCRHHEPNALDVTEGISVGHGDDYKYDVDYQWLDITTIPTGTYTLVATANPDRRLQETDYTNNSSSLAVSIKWHTSKTQAPDLRVVRVCRGTDRC